jgi:hypothetical protein
MSKFVLTAQLQLQAPTNVRQVAQQIQNQLNNVTVNVQVQNAQQAAQQVTNVTNATNKATTAAERMGKAFAVSIKRFAAFSIATRAVGLLTSTLGDAVSEAIDFERQLIKVAQVTGKAVSQLSDLKREIDSLSIGLGTSSRSLLEVSRTLSQAGLSARDTKVALESLAKTTLAPTFDDITQTAEGAVAVLAQFKQGAAALEKQLGAINAVAGQFAVEAGDLIAVIRRTGGVFREAGGDLNELIGLFTSVRATTRESAESIATGLRTIFTRIQRPKTIEFLKQFGVQLTDTRGRFVGAYEAIARLNEALSGLESGDIRFVQIAEQLGGFRQIGKVIPLLKEFRTAEMARQAAMAGADSLTNDAAKAQETLAVKIVKVQEAFLKLIRDVTQTTTFQIMANSALAMADSLIRIADAIKPLLPLLTALAAFKLAKTFGNFGSGLVTGIKNIGKNNQGGRILHFNSGGMVPGQGNRDTVPAMLSPGEFVIRKSSVKKLGSANLAAMNQNRFNLGGLVDEVTGGKRKVGIMTGSLPMAAGRKGLTKTVSSTVSSDGTTGGLDVPIDKILKAKPEKFKRSLTQDGYTATTAIPGIAGKTIESLAGSYNTMTEGLDPKIYGKFVTAVATGLGQSVANGANALAGALGTTVETNTQGIADQFLNSNDGNSILGGMFEDALNQFRSSSQLASPVATGGRASFDYTTGVPAGAQGLYESLTQFGASFLDAKLRGAQIRDDMNVEANQKVQPAEYRKKISNQLAEEIMLMGGGAQAAAREQGKSDALIASKKQKMAKLEENYMRDNKFFGGPISKFASGGRASDTVPALLTPGEFVFSRRASQSIGYGALNKMNKQGVQGFASGGPVGPVQTFNTGGPVIDLNQLKSSEGVQIAQELLRAFRETTAEIDDCNQQLKALDKAAENAKDELKRIEDEPNLTDAQKAGGIANVKQDLQRIADRQQDLLAQREQANKVQEQAVKHAHRKSGELGGKGASNNQTADAKALRKSLKGVGSTGILVKQKFTDLVSHMTMFKNRVTEAHNAAMAASGSSKQVTAANQTQASSSLGAADADDEGAKSGMGFAAKFIVLQSIIGMFGGTVQETDGFFSALGKNIANTVMSLGILAAAAKQAGIDLFSSEGIKSVADKISNAGKYIETFGSRFPKLSGLSGRLGSGFAKVGKFVGKLSTGMILAVAAVGLFAYSLGKTMEEMAKRNKEAAIEQGNVDAAGDAATAESAQGVGTILGTLATVIGTAVALFAGLSNPIGWIVLAVAGLASILGAGTGLFKNFFNLIRDAASFLTLGFIDSSREIEAAARVEAVRNKITAAANKQAEVFAETMKDINEGRSTAQGALLDPKIWNEVNTAAEGMTEQLNYMASNGAQAWLESLSPFSFLMKAVDAVTLGFTDLSSGVDDMMDTITGRTSNTTQTALNAIEAGGVGQGGMWQSFKEWWYGIDEEMVKGLKEMQKAVMDSFHKMADLRKRAAAEALVSGDILTGQNTDGTFNKVAATLDSFMEDQVKKLSDAGVDLSAMTPEQRAEIMDTLAKEYTTQTRVVRENLERLKALNFGLSGLSGTVGMLNSRLDNLSLSFDTGSSQIKSSLNKLSVILEEGGSLPVVELDAALSGINKKLTDFGIDPKAAKQTTESFKALSVANDRFQSVTQKFINEQSASARGLNANDFADQLEKAIRDDLVGEGVSNEAANRIIESMALTPDQMQKLQSGDMSVIKDAMSNINDKMKEELAIVTKIAEAEEKVLEFNAERLQAENKLLDAQRAAINLQLEAAKIQAQHGGKRMTAERERDFIIRRANVGASNIGVGNLSTGSVAEIRERRRQMMANSRRIQTEGFARFGADREAKFFGSGQAGQSRENQEQNLIKAQEQHIRTIKELIRVEEDHLKTIQEKNRLEKESLEALISGNVEDFLKKQAAAGATAAVATGDSRLAGLFGAEALAGAFANLQQQQEAGVTSLFGQQLGGAGGLVARAGGAALSARGIADPRMAALLAGTTAQEEASRGRIRGLAGELGAAGEMAIQTAQMNVERGEFKVGQAQILVDETVAAANKKSTELQGLRDSSNIDERINRLKQQEAQNELRLQTARTRAQNELGPGADASAVNELAEKYYREAITPGSIYVNDQHNAKIARQVLDANTVVAKVMPKLHSGIKGLPGRFGTATSELGKKIVQSRAFGATKDMALRAGKGTLEFAKTVGKGIANKTGLTSLGRGALNMGRGFGAGFGMRGSSPLTRTSRVGNLFGRGAQGVSRGLFNTLEKGGGFIRNQLGTKIADTTSRFGGKATVGFFRKAPDFFKNLINISDKYGMHTLDALSDLKGGTVRAIGRAARYPIDLSKRGVIGLGKQISRVNKGFALGLKHGRDVLFSSEAKRVVGGVLPKGSVSFGKGTLSASRFGISGTKGMGASAAERIAHQAQGSKFGFQSMTKMGQGYREMQSKLVRTLSRKNLAGVGQRIAGVGRNLSGLGFASNMGRAAFGGARQGLGGALGGGMRSIGQFTGNRLGGLANLTGKGLKLGGRLTAGLGRGINTAVGGTLQGLGKGGNFLMNSPGAIGRSLKNIRQGLGQGFNIGMGNLQASPITRSSKIGQFLGKRTQGISRSLSGIRQGFGIGMGKTSASAITKSAKFGQGVGAVTKFGGKALGKTMPFLGHILGAGFGIADKENASKSMGREVGTMEAGVLGALTGSSTKGGSLLSTIGNFFGGNIQEGSETDIRNAEIGAGMTGALGGAAIGTMFGPGIGTAIGALIGGLAGVIAEKYKSWTDQSTQTMHAGVVDKPFMGRAMTTGGVELSTAANDAIMSSMTDQVKDIGATRQMSPEEIQRANEVAMEKAQLLQDAGYGGASVAAASGGGGGRASAAPAGATTAGGVGAGNLAGSIGAFNASVTSMISGLNSFVQSMSQNITRLENMTFNVKLDTTNVNINFNGTGFLESLTANIKSELLNHIANNVIPQLKHDSGGNHVMGGGTMSQ